jgi:hypothetical protein
MELAKRGNPHAIAALINRSLSSKGIHAEAALEAECLKISLQASQIPNQKAVVTIVHRGMMILQVEQIKRVKIFTYRSDNNSLVWQQEINLNSNIQQPLPPQKIADASNLVQAIAPEENADLVSNQKGVILVKKLSQIQRNLQEYQDVIVRFTDEHVGSVRCLTTLTELIEVISKPSFLFAAVASNPNLRSLLDTIAEYSRTDEHGDQVITNLSILQPGQQWQKAKIRLVTKIFLEPAEEQSNAEDRHQGITVDLDESQEPQPEIYPVLETPNPVIYPTYPEVVDFPSQIIPEVNNLEDLDTEAALESITASSSFDDFPESSLPTPQIIDDVTAVSDSADSLFDEFMEAGDRNLSRSPIAYQEDQATVPIDADDDLFDNFSFAGRSPNNQNPANNIDAITSDAINLESDIDAIKSRIPKQNLEQLLMLMNEDDRTKIELRTAESKLTASQSNASNALNKEKNAINAPQTHLDSDIGATTLERVLGNIDTITINAPDRKNSESTSDFVTLENFLEDIDSGGF